MAPESDDALRMSSLDVSLTADRIEELLGEESRYLLGHTCRTIPAADLHRPGSEFVERVFASSNRPTPVLRNLESIFAHGRLGGTGYLSLLPFDHGVGFGAGSAFAPNPRYFDPNAALELAAEAGCSGVVTTFGILGATARRYAHRIPLILKFNHDERLTYPPPNVNLAFARIEDAWRMGCVGVAATVYFGSTEGRRQLVQVSEAFARARDLGMATILFCYLREPALHVNGLNYEYAADLTGQANHLGATIGADILKQKLPAVNGGFTALGPGYGRSDERMYKTLMTDHPIDMTRYQVVNGYAARCGLVNSGGASGRNDLRDAVKAAVINKRAGGLGLIVGRKAFQRPLREGVRILRAVQDVYLEEAVALA